MAHRAEKKFQIDGLGEVKEQPPLWPSVGGEKQLSLGREHVRVGKRQHSEKLSTLSQPKMIWISFRIVMGLKNLFGLQGPETPEKATENDLNNKEMVLSHITRCAERKRALVNSVAQRCRRSPKLLPSFYSETLVVPDMSSELLFLGLQEG